HALLTLRDLPVLSPPGFRAGAVPAVLGLLSGSPATFPWGSTRIASKGMYQMIEAVGLTKRYGDRLAVDRLSFTVKPGQVTGFLGPNGAGKSTTMRMILGLDRPTDGTVDGLDPEGILWIRNLMKTLAAEGRTVFVSSHLMSEMENTADHLLVIGQGRLIADCTVREFINQNSELAVRVRTPEPDRLAQLVTTEGGKAVPDGESALLVTELPMDRVG